MIVNKVVTLNTIEPAPLSFRAPMGIETKLDVTFYDQNGAAHTQDLAAQLQLTARSADRTATYLMPSTDVVNGKARAVIPAHSITDPNGYRLRLVGTLDGEAALLAMGVLTPVAGAGPDALPQDVIDRINLAFERNEAGELDIRLWDDTGKTDPFDLTTATITASIFASAGGPVLAPFSVTVTGTNTLRLSLTVEQVNGLPDQCWWSLSASAFSGLTTLAEGNVTVTGTVTPPLVTSVLNYDYQKPDNADPVSGQIVHGSFTQSTLKVSKTDSDAADVSATLALLVPGDQIIAGVTTWSVQRARDMVGWYEFDVLPIQQAAVTGVTPVTFTRPAG